MAIAVGAQGEILSLPTSHINASWAIDFWAPSLQCTNASASERQAIWENVFEYLNNGSCQSSFGYLAWAPTNNSILPFFNDTGNLDFRTNTLTYGGPTSLYVATIPDMFSQSVQMSGDVILGGCVLVRAGKDQMQDFFDDASLLECRFSNSSYSTNISYINGIQNIETSIAHPAAPITPQACIQGPVPLDSVYSDPNFYYEVLEANCSTFNMDGEHCKFDMDLVRIIAYQGVIDAFVQLIQGNIGLTEIHFDSLNVSSNIVKTILIEADDLAFIQNYSPEGNFPDLASIAESSHGSLLHGLSNAKTAGTRGSLARAMEEMFRNFTLSLMSDQYLQ